MKIDGTSRVGDIATEQPLATRVFARHGIDFCCGGGAPIGVVCEAKGLDTDLVLEEIAAELSVTDADVQRWDRASLDELIDHILDAYHGPLREELPRLEFMARKVARVHGDKLPDVLPQLLSTFLALKSELESHMVKEEQVLFPLIRQGRGGMAGAPISVMEHEHASAGAALAHLRELTSGFEVPVGACNTWRALWFGLAALEESLHQHIHLENNILFPRSLGTVSSTAPAAPR